MPSSTCRASVACASVSPATSWAPMGLPPVTTCHTVADLNGMSEVAVSTTTSEGPPR
jgi:hypothetical protein